MMGKLSDRFFALALIAFVAASVWAEGASGIRLSTRGFRANRGYVYASIYASPVGFPGDSKKALAFARAEIKEGIAELIFEGLKPGIYAISFYHDENGNGAFDKGFLGIPMEPYGFSNDARGLMGPPSFLSSAFRYEGGLLRLSAIVSY